MSHWNLNYFKPCPETCSYMEKIRAAYMELEDKLHSLGFDEKHTREAALARTKLEESLMWAIKNLCILDKQIIHVPKPEEVTAEDIL